MNDDSPMPFPPPQDDRLSQEEINTRLAIAELLSDAERRGQDVLDHAKGKALEEAEKIIAAAAEEASAAMIRHGESVERDGGIQRLIEFPPELRQAGIAILSYFAEVLKQKYPDQARMATSNSPTCGRANSSRPGRGDCRSFWLFPERLFGKRSASGRRQAPGSGGQATDPAGAVHRLVLWTGGLVHGGRVRHGQFVVSGLTARRCAASFSR
jgi:hypothetical protein